jgi:hypothetical protein
MTNPPWYAPIVAKASGWLSAATDIAELAQGSTVNLAVTGLSRSGKTVFITSLIHNLLSAVHNPNRMPLLGVVNGAACSHPAPGGGLRPAAALRYEENRGDGGGRRPGPRAPTTCARSASSCASCRPIPPASS